METLTKFFSSMYKGTKVQAPPIGGVAPDNHAVAGQCTDCGGSWCSVQKEEADAE